MFKLVPSAFDKGDYSFSGKRLVSHSVSLILSEKEISEIFEQIEIYTQNQNCDYALIFDEPNTGNRVVAIDNISETEKQEFRDEGICSEEQIAAHDYYTLVFDGEPMI